LIDFFIPSRRGTRVAALDAGEQELGKASAVPDREGQQLIRESVSAPIDHDNSSGKVSEIYLPDLRSSLGIGITDQQQRGVMEHVA
jgi:hypothetical protein